MPNLPGFIGGVNLQQSQSIMPWQTWNWFFSLKKIISQGRLIMKKSPSILFRKHLVFHGGYLGLARAGQDTRPAPENKRGLASGPKPVNFWAGPSGKELCRLSPASGVGGRLISPVVCAVPSGPFGSWHRGLSRYLAVALPGKRRRPPGRSGRGPRN